MHGLGFQVLFRYRATGHTGDGEDARTQNVRQTVNDALRIAPIADHSSKLRGGAKLALRRGAITLPFGVIRPPSKAAVTFLPCTAVKVKGSNVSSVMAVWLEMVNRIGWHQQPVLTPDQIFTLRQRQMRSVTSKTG